ncbi:histidine kinase dimerization/phosphoacceptor domain -containing protein [Sphingomonas lenta]|uniref:histidine kinase n=1 Tax=Sphingomonas lenta TaxID=1141887 RepID=A0A2A2SG08_9SPHN|nr:histidine kinase dimerization/phosphoacceptor domain -containing protein [Sphingomonas lenta]PAX08142.1 histidine kinase [Sphingomonas lenta]
MTAVAPAASLDDLSAEALDALPFGVIQVDAAGRITLYNQAESRFSGRDPAQVMGRDFFREVAPCTNLPAFHGRFLEGVRRGALDAEFGFVFGFDPPARVRVAMREAREPGRYWIVVHQLGLLAPSRHRMAADMAQDAVDRRSRAEPIDASVCEREPIHIPGSVQPHAAMLAVDPDTLSICACSDNLADMAGVAPADVLGRGLDAVLPDAVVVRLRHAVEVGGLTVPTRPWRETVRLGPEERCFALTAHLNDGRLVVELEMLPDRPEDFGAATAAQAGDAVNRIRSAPTLADAAAACADEIRAMTGFERVLVYRFDADWNGEALGESKVEDYPSLLGLRFPASDIPAQARALYTKAPARFVVDRDAVPAAVLAEPAAANQTVDLTYAYSRALSPIHLEYQRNLGVNGSMSISVVAEGVLWGLIIGHHRRPHYVTPETRALAGLVTDAFALRVHELASNQAWREQQAALTVQNALLRRLAGADDVVAALTEGAPTMADLLNATGAAVWSEGRVATAGATPPEHAVGELAAWLAANMPAERRAFATADLSEHWAGAAAHADTAAGLLAAWVDPERRHLLLWFRPEVAGTVAWGGDPNAKVLADTATRTVLPRRSFERWVEERRGEAEPWAAWQVDAAAGFAAAVEGVVLRQGRKIAELSAKQAALSLALEQKEVLAREIDHRVRNSLQIVASVMLLQARKVDDDAARAAFEDTYARVMSVARVHDSLQHAETAEMVDIGQTLRQLCDDLGQGIVGAGGRLEVDAAGGLMVPSRTAVALSLIATELVTNALKYAYAPGEDGPIHVRVLPRDEGGLCMQVCDEGRGLPEDWADRPRSTGGLGMRVIRAMLQQIGGELKVDTDRRPGACFTVAA